MIEIEYEGPRLRGLLVMVLAFVAMSIVLIGSEDPEAMTAEGWGLVAVFIAGTALQLWDLRLYDRENPDQAES